MNKTVILDAGHNKNSAGRKSPDGTYCEYEFNEDIRSRMHYHLRRHGINVVYVDSSLESSSKELQAIVKQANESNGDIYVSLHSNAFGIGFNSANGWEIFSYSLDKSTNGYKLAKAIHDASIPALGLKDRGIKKGSHLYVVKNTKMPAVLIEHGFHTNKIDLAKLKSDSFRREAAICNVKGILAFFGMEWKDEVFTTYKVQVGAFSDKSNAERLQKELKTKGYPAIIVEE